MIFGASEASTGNGIESIVGGGATKGDVGLEDCRFMSLLPEDFFSRGCSGGVAYSGMRLVAMFGKSIASRDPAEGLWSSVMAGDPDELMLLTRCLFSNPGGALLWANMDISKVRVLGRTLLLVLALPGCDGR